MPEPQETVKVSKEILNSNPANNVEVETSCNAESVHNDKNLVANKTDTPTKNKHNLTISIPPNEESPANTVQSTTNETPVEYEYKYEVRDFVISVMFYMCRSKNHLSFDCYLPY